MKTTPYELVFGQPPRHNIFPGVLRNEIMEENVEDILKEDDDKVTDEVGGKTRDDDKSEVTDEVGGKTRDDDKSKVADEVGGKNRDDDKSEVTDEMGGRNRDDDKSKVTDEVGGKNRDDDKSEVTDEVGGKTRADDSDQDEEKNGTNSLATREKHRHLREAADKQYRLNAERMKLKYCKAKRKKVLTFSVGDIVSVRIPRIDRTSTDFHILPCVVVERLGTKFHLYRLRCRHGIIKTCYGEGNLELFQGDMALTVEGWQDERMLSLREAAQLLNPRNEFHSSCCNCKKGCMSQQCICRKKGAPCCSKCHGGRKCSNWSESADDSDRTPRKKGQSKKYGKRRASDVSLLEDSDADQPQSKKHDNKKDEKALVISSDDESTSEVEKWLPELFLKPEDKQLIETNDWLSDRHITAAQILPQKDFPQVDGLQETTLAETGGWKILVGEGVQILNDSNKHWVCVSTIGCPPNTIDCYDSKSKKASPHIIQQIASFLHCWAPHFTIRLISSQLQQGSSDCGLFAIATATALCHGESPNSSVWDQNQMRPHLLKSFEQGKMTPFPGWELRNDQIGSEEVVKDQKVKVYCSCRLPQNRKKMAQCIKCHEWIHQTCENIVEDVFRKRLPFTCSC